MTMMDFSHDQQTFFATCPHGIEAPLTQEIEEAGFIPTPQKGERGGLTFTGPLAEIPKILLNSRLAGRIYLKLFNFTYKNPKDLHRKIVKEDLTTLFSVNKTFKIQTTLIQGSGRKDNTLFLSQTTKDAVVDSFQEKLKKRPDIDLKYPDLIFLQYIQFRPKEKNFHLTFYVDLCGEPISNRQYREFKVRAPLRENLAAGIIKLMNFDPQNELFIDGMCGSGTFLIEALLMKGDIPPSFFRVENRIPFSLEKINPYIKNPNVKESLKKEKKEVLEKAKKGFALLRQTKTKFYGYDISERAVKSSKNHLDVLGLLPFAKIQKANILHIRPETMDGVFFCNLPYGERLEIEDLEKLYYDVGEHLKHNYKGFKAFLLSGNIPLRKKIGLMTKSRIPVMNGGIECRLWEYHLY